MEGIRCGWVSDDPLYREYHDKVWGQPDIIIGDGDSLSETNRLKYADLIFHNPDQETNDQTKAVQYLLSKGKRKIAIVGATGKREDHTIGNVSLLMEYMRMGAESKI